LAAEIKRTDSTLRKLAAELGGLSEVSRRTMLDAAAILASIGKDKKTEAKKIKDAEAAIERAREAAEKEAAQILASWTQAELADQIAICLAWRDPWNFEGERDLREGLKGYTFPNGEHRAAGRRDVLSVLSDAKRALQREAGYRASLKGQPVAEFMATVRTGFDAARQGDTCRQLVEAWQVALVQERLTEANKGTK
jgi:hypothetical protein